MCNCIDEVNEKTFQYAKNAYEKNNETILPLDYDEGIQNLTLMLGDDNNQPSGYVQTTTFEFRTTFKKKDGSTSKPKKNRPSLIFTFCPFCGVKYAQNNEAEAQ